MRAEAAAARASQHHWRGLRLLEAADAECRHMPMNSIAQVGPGPA